MNFLLSCIPRIPIQTLDTKEYQGYVGILLIPKNTKRKQAYQSILLSIKAYQGYVGILLIPKNTKRKQEYQSILSITISVFHHNCPDFTNFDRKI